MNTHNLKKSYKNWKIVLLCPINFIVYDMSLCIKTALEFVYIVQF